MPKLLSLTTRQIAFAVVYSAIFPLSNLVGGVVAGIGIVVTLPFLGLAWIGGMTAVSLVGNEAAYLAGAFLTILTQVLLLLLVRAAVSRRSGANAN